MRRTELSGPRYFTPAIRLTVHFRRNYGCYEPLRMLRSVFTFTNVTFSRTAGIHYECYVLAPLIYVIFGYLQMLRYKPEELQMLRLS